MMRRRWTVAEAPIELAESQEPKHARPHCQATTKAGKPCRSTALVDGKHCLFHAPDGLDPAELGRKGGQKSAVARRSHEKNGQKSARRGAREILREAFETDEEWIAAVKAVYMEGLHATDKNGIPKH